MLLPDDLLSDGSITGGLRSQISDSDCEDVEIIGWLYQFYISEKKDQVIGKVVKSEDIPAATQLFTPNWIVKYMVQNTLGATWLATYPDSSLKGTMEFYIEPAEQTPEVHAQLSATTPESLDPEELTLIDPACGSGHILVEAYELLKAIYLERGYRQRDIPELILTKNLYGLDICSRAAQLAAFSLLMKGREDDRRLLDRGIQLNVMALQDSTGLNVERLAASLDQSVAGVTRADVRMLVELFTDATTFGSLIQVPPLLADKLPALAIQAEQSSQDLFAANDIRRLRVLARQATLLAQRYDAIVVNPPFMGSKGMNGLLKNLALNSFPNTKSDTFTCFFERSLCLCKDRGRLGFMSPFVWMFNSSHEWIRQRFIVKETISSLIQLEYSGFEGATVPVCTFSLQRGRISGEKGCFIRLSSFRGSANQAPKALEAIKNRNCGWIFEANQDDFTRIPGSPIAYWANESVKNLFSFCPRLESLGEPRRGLQPGDTPKHVRVWHEVDLRNTAFSIETENVDNVTQEVKWVGFTSGGSYRKWAGNLSFLVNWKRRGYDIKHGHNPIVPSEHLYFLEAITWSMVSSGAPSFRKHPRGLIPGNAAPFAVIPYEHYDAIFASLNAKVTPLLLQILAPTLNFLTGDIANLPILLNAECATHVPFLLRIAEDDWNAYERSWDFQCSPLLLQAPLEDSKDIETIYSSWISHNRTVIGKMKRLEEANNALLISQFGLGDELDPGIQINEITLTINPSYRYEAVLSDEEQWIRFRRDTMAEFLSYATGCMMGRYSLDQPGLILADSRDSQAEQLAAYEAKVGKPLSEDQFKPDPDGVIPVLDGEWFEDDIVARTREFLEVTFPESSVGENLRFIEESLGKDIRKYFCTDFYKDHLQTYKKRPIYWLVQSPKKGFACLIYLHRYTKDTLNQVLNNYFRPYLQKLEAHLAQLGLDQLNDALPTRERTAARKEAEKITKVLKECQAWEQDALLPLAQQRIELDLDDGVKVNYLKLQDVLAPIPGLAAKEE